MVPDDGLKEYSTFIFRGHKFRKEHPTQGGKEIYHFGLPVSGLLERVEPVWEMAGGV